MLLAGVAWRLSWDLPDDRRARFGDASLFSQYKYTGLYGPLGLGFLLWGELPDWWTLLGTV
ncbi:MAG: hypothetical protein CM1200mP18_21570 [Gammaproteobacteria bacterium]|nr:MAG: hypothetical protein CM1200mP18_21570 [Gammaproteobacteria bacterium]